MGPCCAAQSIRMSSLPMNVLCGKIRGQSSGRAELHLCIFEPWHYNSLAETRAWRHWDLEHKPPETGRNLGKALTSMIHSYFSREGQGGWRLNAHYKVMHIYIKKYQRERERSRKKKKSLRVLSSRYLRVWPEECIWEGRGNLNFKGGVEKGVTHCWYTYESSFVGH